MVDLLKPPSLEAQSFDYILAFNVFQVAPAEVIDALYKLGQYVLRTGGKVVTYSPLTHQGHFTSEGDAAFDARLRDRDPRLGIRSKEALSASAKLYGFDTFEEYSMPANNWLTVAS